MQSKSHNHNTNHHISQRHTNTLPQSIFPLVFQARGHGDAGGQALINDPADNDGVEASLTRLLQIPTNTGMKMKLHVLHVQSRVHMSPPELLWFSLGFKHPA